MEQGKLISLRYHQALQAWRDGNRCLALTDEVGALASFQAAIRYDPDIWQAYIDLGRLYQRQGAMETALTILARAVVRTEAPEVHLAFANACVEAGDYRRATVHFERATRLLGDAEPDVYFDWALAALAIDDVKQVSTCLARYRRLRPHDPRGAALADEMPRMVEFPAAQRHTPKAQAYIKDRAILLGCASDDGLDIASRPAVSLRYADLAVMASRFLHLAEGLAWDWDGFVVGTRSVRPWVQALSLLTGKPIVGRQALGLGQRLILVEMNWCEAAAIRLLDLQERCGQGWGLSLGIKFGARATALTGLLAMVSVPWYRTGALPTSAGQLEAGPYLDANESACIPLILRAFQELAEPESAAQIEYYAGLHRQHLATGLAREGDVLQTEGFSS